MAIILALENLYNLVTADLAASSTIVTTAQKFGWRETSRQDGGNARIVWVPGDPDGNLGALLPAKYPSRSITTLGRPLANLGELFYVTISAADPTAPDNEIAQYHATRLLYDAWIAAVYRAARGTFGILKQRWVIDKNERRWGAALEITGSIQAVIPDSVAQAAPVDTGAAVVGELDSNGEPQGSGVTDPEFDVAAGS